MIAVLQKKLGDINKHVEDIRMYCLTAGANTLRSNQQGAKGRPP